MEYAFDGISDKFLFRRKMADADAFDASFASVAEHIAARADIEAEVRDCQIIVRTLDGIARNVYATNPGRLAAWLAASHVEKAPKKKDPPAPPTP